MLQVRKLVLAVAAASAFSSGLAHALGLGDLSVKSSLNQPLDAEISLLEVRDLTSIEIKTQLASAEEFSKAGVDRQFFLTGLKFTPVINANGKSVIRVTSANPVKEPYLNFLVEILWPNGRLLREYTVLLDPPLYKPQQVIYAPQPASVASSNRSSAPVQQRPRAAQASAPTPQVSQPVARTTNALQGSEYSVQKNDTLWEIAARVGGNAAVHQTMLAIQDLNPNAFLDGNINRMKSGQVLRLPTEQDINSRSRAEAIAQVAQQNTSWKTERVAQTGAERQLDATHRSEAGAAPATVEKTDNLRLVADAPGQAQQAADQGDAANGQAVQDQLATAKERLDSTALENEDLKSRVEGLNSQLEKLQRLIELKDNQLAQLQNSVDAPVAVPESVASTPAAETNLATEVAPAAAEDTLTTEVTPDPAIESVENVAEGIGEVVENSEATAETEVLAVEPQLTAEPEPLVETETVTQPQAEANIPAAVPVQDEQSLVEKVMDDPMLLAAAGGGAVLALLLLLMAISRRNARKEAEFYDAQFNDVVAEPENVQAGEKAVATDFLADSDFDKADDTTEASLVDEFDFESTATETQFKAPVADPIAEANSYISFGRFHQAAEVLTAAVDQEPQRIDLRLKLVEVYADLEDRDGFARQIQDISEIGGASSEIAQIKSRYPQMFDTEQVADVADNDGFDNFDLNDLTLDLPADVKTNDSAATSELDDLSALLAETEAEVKAADNDFNLDADLDFSLGENLVEPSRADSTSLDDFNFDLDAGAVADKSATTVADDFNDEFGFEADSQIDSDFGAQLDEVNAELDTLSSSLSGDALEMKTSPEIDGLADTTTLATAETATESMENFGDFEDLDGLDDDFGMLAGTDETATKLDLARAYVEMGDAEGARDILDEVIAEGTSAQQDTAREMIAQLG